MCVRRIVPCLLFLLAFELEARAKTPPPSPENWPSELVYRVYERAGLPVNAPVLVMVHGYGDSGRGFIRMAQRLRVPFRVVLPDGPIKMRGHSRSWYRIRSPKAHEDVRRSGGLLAKLLQEIARRWPEAPKPILGGFSQGGVMSYHMAARYPGLLSAVYPIAGYLIPETFLPPIAPPNAPPMLVVHGSRDGVVRYLLGETAIQRFRSRGWDIQHFRHEGRHEIPTAAILESRRWLRTQQERLSTAR